MKLLILFSSLLTIAISGSLLASIVNTKHNLSATGTGTINATDGEQEICIFCHTPHNADPVAPLWNRSSSGAAYTPYDSTTLIGTPGQPTGSSVLCLSCHDGTIALGQTLSRTTDITLNETVIPIGATMLGTDLSDDHPVSFEFTSALAAARGELVDPASLTAEVRLDNTGQMQCTSCHDPHTETNDKFLVKSNTASGLCITCHAKDYWSETSHSTSTATWNNIAPDPWPHTTEITVENNACENCHNPHSAGNPERILNYAAEEDNCLSCHNGNVTTFNIEAEFNKFSFHPITLTQGVHDTAETNLVTARHVECYDCHNPHGANATNPLNGARGIDISGADISPVNFTYEVCFRCHADSTGKPAALTTRMFVQTNTRQEFDTTNSTSHHPVASVGKNTFVPSLIAPLTTSSLVSCLDCHNNDQNPNAGGTGPSGPHGSVNSPILERNYTTIDGTVESATAYAMCYKCHDRNTAGAGILADASFLRHNFHVTGSGARPGANLSTPCNICHDPHASEGQEKLINFDTTVVTPNAVGILDYKPNTAGTGGQCNLSCHNQNHGPCGYDRADGSVCGTCVGGPGNACPPL